MFFNALSLVAAEAGAAGESDEINPFIYGGVALVVLLLLLYVVTRWHIYR
jgi:hypothetical protein